MNKLKSKLNQLVSKVKSTNLLRKTTTQEFRDLTTLSHRSEKKILALEAKLKREKEFLAVCNVSLGRFGNNVRSFKLKSTEAK